MKKRFEPLSPFNQVLFMIALGAVIFAILGMVLNVIVGQAYPKMVLLDINSKIREFPIQYMIVSFLPLQVGFFLVPGLIYWKWTRKEHNLLHKPHIIGISWSILLFVSVFGLLPFLGEINESILRPYDFGTNLIMEKHKGDVFLQTLIGIPGSTTFYVASLLIGLITGTAEEFIFRRFLFHHILKNTRHLIQALLLSAFIFALLHFNYIQFLPLFAFGVVLSMMYYVSGSILPGIILHSANNILNIYWLANNSTPAWMESIDLKITIPSTLMLMGLLFFFTKRYPLPND